jgi:hypothetical protein
MAISWCPNRKRTVDVTPGSVCPICGFKTLALNLSHTASFFGRAESADIDFALRDITKTGIVRLRPGKTSASMIGGVVLAKAGENPLDAVVDLMKVHRIKIGTPVWVKGTLATAGTDRILFVDSIGKTAGGLGRRLLSKSAGPGLRLKG